MTSAASRDGYGAALLDLANDDRIVVLEADLGKSTKSCLFRAEYPNRTFSMGIAEQNMMLVAAGMASTGKIPFASTFAIFTERGFEQVRNGIARPNLKVHLCGSHGGIHTGTDGSSAQSIEDLAIYRTLPNMTVMHPCDDLSTKALTKALVEHDRPSYTRTARNKTKRIYSEVQAESLEIGKFSIIREGEDVAILACGVMVSEAIDAADKLESEGVKATVVDVHTIKPIDKEAIIQSKESDLFVSVEEHSIIGGLGDIVSDAISETENSPAQLKIGINDTFVKEIGKRDYQFEIHGLNATKIYEKIIKC